MRLAFGSWWSSRSEMDDEPPGAWCSRVLGRVSSGRSVLNRWEGWEAAAKLAMGVKE